MKAVLIMTRDLESGRLGLRSTFGLNHLVFAHEINHLFYTENRDSVHMFICFEIHEARRLRRGSGWWTGSKLMFAGATD